MKVLKRKRAITSHSNSPKVNLQNQFGKDTTVSYQNFSIIRLHVGVYYLVHAYLSEPNQGGTEI